MLRGYSFRAAAVLVALWLAALGLASHNLHSLTESTSYDRLLLGLRLCLGDGTDSRWDPNFPLGSALIYATPCALGLPSVVFGRAVSFVAFAGVLALLARLARRLGGSPAGAILAVAAVPAVARGAVVVGEESLFTASVLGVVVAGVERRPGLAVAAVNVAVLCRLDAMALVPLVAAGVVAAGRGRRRFVLGAACGASAALHLAVAAAHGGALGFAGTARREMARAAPGFGGERGPGTLFGALAEQLGGAGGVVLGAAVLAAAAWGGLRLWRGGRGRVLVALTAWMLGVTAVATAAGAFEPRSPRMIVPLLVLLVACAVVGLGQGTDGRGAGAGGAAPEGAAPRVRGIAAVAVVGLLVALGPPRAWQEATIARLPPGLVEASRALGQRPSTERAVVDEQHPVVVVESGRPPASVGLTSQGTRGAIWRVEVTESGARLVDLR